MFHVKRHTTTIVNKGKFIVFLFCFLLCSCIGARQTVQISDYILDQINIKEKLFGFNINFEKVQQFCTKEKIFIPISFHPPARRDISGLVSKDIQLEKIVQAILSVDKQFIKSAEIYDVYQGKNVPENQKSVSIHIVYQSNEKTLDSKSIDRLQNEVLSKLIKSFNWQPR